MTLRLLAGALLCVLFASNADARPRHHRHHIPDIGKMVGCSDPVMRPCYPGGAASSRRGRAAMSRSERRGSLARKRLQRHERLALAHRESEVAMPPGLRRVMAEGAGRVVAPARFIHGRLVCAVNVGMALAARGIRGTGSRLAKSYLHWGHASGPVPGAVAVFNRRGGGHVAIVHHVRPDGTVIYLNPSSRRQAWQVGPYSRKPIAFRIAGGW